MDAVKFALATTENIVITVPDSFNSKTIKESYVAELYNEDFASCALIFMAALLYRNRITEVPISEGEYDDMLYQQYIHEVRPDMLKLYIALNQPKQKNGKDFITDIKITAGGNSPILINNKDSWFENKLNEYLHQYLGVSNLEEAQKELDYEKYVIEDGVRYHHILDPKTGYPADSGLISVTIVCDDGWLSDGLSTACFVLGYEDSLPLLEIYQAEAVFVTEDKEVIVTDGLKDMFTLTDSSYEQVEE